MSTQSNLTEASMSEWIKSSFSGAECCVEVAPSPDGGVFVRDSKQHGKTAPMYFTRAEFTAFLDGAKNDEFDHLVADQL